MTYYKATRPDGKSFHDAKTAWAVGETVKIKKKDRRADLCGVGILHAADAPGETLVGGSWPCRLFEVEGEPVAQEGHKFGFHELTVIRELPAWQALGPNGEAAAALIERAGRLTEDEARRLEATRAAAATAYATAYAAATAAYAAASSATRAAAYAAAAATAAYAAAAYDAAAYDAAVSAAWALVVRDLISEEQFQVLYGPWASVMEVEE